MRSRWDTSKRLDENGAQVPVLFTANDLDMCKLLCPTQGVRTPWSYQYLPTGYIHPLLGREAQYISNRAQELVCEPYAKEYTILFASLAAILALLGIVALYISHKFRELRAELAMARGYSPPPSRPAPKPRSAPQPAQTRAPDPPPAPKPVAKTYDI